MVPQSYTYAEPHGDYTIQVTSHEDAGTSDCAQLTVKFPSAENAAVSVPLASGEAPVTVTSVGVGYQPTGVTFDGANIWVANSSGNTMTEIQPNNGNVLGTFPTGSYPTGVAFDGVNIWIACNGAGSGNTMTVLSAATGQQLPFSPVPTGGNNPREVVFDGQNVWVANSASNTVSKVQAGNGPGSGTLLGTFAVGAGPDALAFDGSNVWVSNRDTNSVTKLQASTGKVLGTYTVGSGPFGIAFDGSHIWVAVSGTRVTELALDGSVLRTVPVANGASGVGFDGVYIWVASQNSHTVTKILASSGRVLDTISVSGNPWGLAFDGANIWVSNFAGSNVWKLSAFPGTASRPSGSASTPSVVQATIRQGGTSLELPPGQMYLYGMSTGGGTPSSQFTAGQYADAKNAAGLLSDALAYGTNSQNSYSTQTAYHDIGGVSVAGSWEHFAAYYGANHQSGAHDASVSFQTNEDSLVVVLGLASSQQFVSVEGIPNLQVNASRTGGGFVIAHANVKAGSYNVIERRKVLATGRSSAHRRSGRCFRL